MPCYIVINLLFHVLILFVIYFLIRIFAELTILILSINFLMQINSYLFIFLHDFSSPMLFKITLLFPVLRVLAFKVRIITVWRLKTTHLHVGTSVQLVISILELSICCVLIYYLRCPKTLVLDLFMHCFLHLFNGIFFMHMSLSLKIFVNFLGSHVCLGLVFYTSVDCATEVECLVWKFFYRLLDIVESS